MPLTLRPVIDGREWRGKEVMNADYTSGLVEKKNYESTGEYHIKAKPSLL